MCIKGKGSGRMKKRFVAVLGIFFLAVTLLSCGNSSKNMDDYVTNKGYLDNNSSNKSSDGKTKAGTKIIAKKDLKIGVLYIGSASDTSGYTYTHELGISQMTGNIGLDDSQIVRKENVDDGNEETIEKAVKDCIDEGCNVIFGTSWGYMDALEKYSKEYPDIYFAHGTGYKSNGKNFTNYFGRIYQARYLSGIVAGLKTKSNKIGYVAAMGSDSSEVTGGIDAFAIGVESVNKDAEIDVIVTNSWYAPDKEDEAAKKLLGNGCDVLTKHCDTINPQQEAERQGVWGIGYNSDMSKEAPKATLTSVVWSWSAYYTSFIQSIIDGSYDGTNYYEGMDVGLVGLADFADFNDSNAEKLVNEAKEKMALH